MNRDQLESTFDQQAGTYDQQWAKLAPFRDGIHLLMASVFSRLPRDARMLCVGAGTGAEIHFLAERFPAWTFVAVEPSSGMVDTARARAGQHGYLDRCTFHTGYLDSLPAGGPFDCASSLLVSQFLLDRDERRDFFRVIATRLKPGGILASSDLSADTEGPHYASLLEVWLRTMAAADLSPERVQQMRDAYKRDVAILPGASVEALITSAGFDAPVQFYQAGLIHAWYCQRLQTDA
ncbi:class I SAM-dependent methyltransferase [Piscinibacter gummiphilus]|uniref:Class I SAM-dependent methyltransferase n=1 Tax=Piscinibacter gummiphilus TaxID=946333 RepID=A0ABZ0CS25_9BURK|nr:class I SAM-dependent methyltransferase [Piscinibacter gummiphilus]WOB07780.1 class I SAM-dependent methyltransferase [Piscinibacter gummiphilus]